jgi:hypothetical protein
MTERICANEGCTEPLIDRPLGQRSVYCAEHNWKSRNHHLKRNDRQEMYHRQYRDLGEQ